MCHLNFFVSVVTECKSHRSETDAKKFRNLARIVDQIFLVCSNHNFGCNQIPSFDFPFTIHVWSNLTDFMKFLADNNTMGSNSNVTTTTITKIVTTITKSTTITESSAAETVSTIETTTTTFKLCPTTNATMKIENITEKTTVVRTYDVNLVKDDDNYGG